MRHPRCDGEVRQRQVLRHLGRNLAGQRIGTALGQILAEPQRQRLLPAVDPPGQHHVHRARLADHLADADRGAAAGEQAALAFRQGIIGRAVRHPDMRRRGEFQPAADHRALQRGNHRHAAVFHLVERLVPAQAQVHERGRAAVLAVMFHQIEPGAEMIALGAQQHGAHARARHRIEQAHQILHRFGIQRVAFFGAAQRHLQHTARAFGQGEAGQRQGKDIRGRHRQILSAALGGSFADPGGAVCPARPVRRPGFDGQERGRWRYFSSAVTRSKAEPKPFIETWKSAAPPPSAWVLIFITLVARSAVSILASACTRTTQPTGRQVR